MDQGSTRKRSAVHNFAPTVTQFCVMWEGQALPHDTKFGNSRCEIVGRRVIFIWSLIHRSSWSGLIKVGPGGGRVRNAGLTVITGNTLLAVACEYCRRAPSDFGYPRGSRVQPLQGSDSSRRARDTAATRSLETKWWIGNKNCQILRRTHSKLCYM